MLTRNLRKTTSRMEKEKPTVSNGESSTVGSNQTQQGTRMVLRKRTLDVKPKNDQEQSAKKTVKKKKTSAEVVAADEPAPAAPSQPTIPPSNTLIITDDQLEEVRCKYLRHLRDKPLDPELRAAIVKAKKSKSNEPIPGLNPVQRKATEAERKERGVKAGELMWEIMQEVVASGEPAQ